MKKGERPRLAFRCLSAGGGVFARGWWAATRDIVMGTALRGGCACVSMGGCMGSPWWQSIEGIGWLFSARMVEVPSEA